MRALKALVIAMGVIIVAGIAVIGITIFNRLSKPTPLPAPIVAPVAATPLSPAPPVGPMPSPGPTPAPPSTAVNLPIGAPLPQQFDRKFGDTTVTIPIGARVSDFSASGDRLVLRVIMPNQEQRLLVVDLFSGNLLGTIKLAAGSDAPNNGGIGLLTPLPAVNVPPRNKSEGLK